MAAAAVRPGKRSRSSERAVIPRLSLQNSEEIEPSPRTPASPRAPLSPRAAPPLTPRGNNNDTPSLKISPRFGTPRDENSSSQPLDTSSRSPQREAAKQSPGNSRTASGRRGGSGAGSARGSNSARLRGASTNANASTSTTPRSARGRPRQNPLLGGSPQVRPQATTAPAQHTQSSPNQTLNNGQSRLSAASSSSSASKSSAEYFSGPSLAGENVVTPSASAASLYAPPSTIKGITGAAWGSGGEEALRRNSNYSERASLRSLAESQHQRASRAETEDFHPVPMTSGMMGQAMSQADLEADSDLFAGSAAEQVEVLCDKAQRLVRQLGASVEPPSSWDPMHQTARSSGRPLSARSSPGTRRVNPQSASPCTPQPVGTCGISPIDVRSSPAAESREHFQHPLGADEGPVASCGSGLGAGAHEELADLRFRLSRMELAFEKERRGAAHADEVQVLRGRLQAVESELLDVRAELREAKTQMASMMKLLAANGTETPATGSSDAISAPTTARSTRPATIDSASEAPHSGQVTPAPSHGYPPTASSAHTRVAVVSTAASPRKPGLPPAGPVMHPSPSVQARPPLAIGASASSTPVQQCRLGPATPVGTPTTRQISAPHQASTPPTAVRVQQAPLRGASSGLVVSQTTQWRTVPWRMPSA
eukprot:TRINITY_DN90770_c0_g1_i1.p1 TRINITY_DN90770_c0_g1~~TRINITY_DN90770_c0_g1_i1.p1  ORF type:complete len:654 (-),score=87.49 TRINITY_DN90770_c0_g1_i1:155-2116(-)